MNFSFIPSEMEFIFTLVSMALDLALFLMAVSRLSAPHPETCISTFPVPYHAVKHLIPNLTILGASQAI